MYPTLEDENRTWAGRFDLIMVTMKNVKVQVYGLYNLRFYNVEEEITPLRCI
jgi:hypothetical protein